MESGGSGPEKDDPPGKMDLYNTQLLCSAVLVCEGVSGNLSWQILEKLCS